MNVSIPGVRCCNVSVVVFRSDDSSHGLEWQYVATVAGPQRFIGGEGPNENALVAIALKLVNVALTIDEFCIQNDDLNTNGQVVHPDGQTLTILLRTAGGEGYPDHHHQPCLLRGMYCEFRLKWPYF